MMPGPIEILVVLSVTLIPLLVLIDCIRNEPTEGDERLIWVVVILMTNIIGAALYWFLRRPKRIAQYGH